MTARSILRRLPVAATVVAAMTLTVASGTAWAQVHPRTGGQASQMQVQAAVGATDGLAAFRAAASAHVHTARPPAWTSGVGAAVTRIAGLVRSGERAPLLHIHF